MTIFPALADAPVVFRGEFGDIGATVNVWLGGGQQAPRGVLGKPFLEP